MAINSMFRRRLESHKGDYGHVFILAGSSEYSGAAVFAALGAIRSGAGLVTLGVPEDIYLATLARISPEIIVRAFSSTKGYFSAKAVGEIRKCLCEVVPDSIVFGPGVTLKGATLELLENVILKQKKTVVIDADGLNALAMLGSYKKFMRKMVLTPHPGEASRLLKKNTELIQINRSASAKLLAKKYKAICLLKGHKSIITDGSRIKENKTGNPGMATAGSGDVLAGIIGALLNQISDAFDSVVLSAQVHGIAGDIAEKKYGQISLTATDILECLPSAFMQLKKNGL